MFQNPVSDLQCRRISATQCKLCDVLYDSVSALRARQLVPYDPRREIYYRDEQTSIPDTPRSVLLAAQEEAHMPLSASFIKSVTGSLNRRGWGNLTTTCSIPPGCEAAAARRSSAQSCSTSSRHGGESGQGKLKRQPLEGSRQEGGQEGGLWLSRRHFLQTAAAAAAGLIAFNQTAKASKLPPALDRAWEAVGGGPSDLYFPEEFLGIWSVESTLASVQLPLGPDFVPDPKVVERARTEDLNRQVRYSVAFVRNREGKVITDRRFNTLSLLDYYLGPGKLIAQDVAWNPNDPNVLNMALPGGVDVTTRVTRRSETTSPPDRLDTSEYFQQVYASPGRREPKVKASQCFTKYKWRDSAAAQRESGPQIVATQVVSDYLTPYDGEMLMMRAKNSPVVVYTYKMRFWRDAKNNAAAA